MKITSAYFMQEKMICSEYTDAVQTLPTQISLPDKIVDVILYIERFLGVVAKYNEQLLEKLLLNYKKTLNSLGIKSEKNKFITQLPINNNKWLGNNSKFLPLIEKAVLFFLNLSELKPPHSEGSKVTVSMIDSIRGQFFPLYYLAYSLLDITSREVVFELARKFTDLCYNLEQSSIMKANTLEEYAKSLHNGVCPKYSNSSRLVKDGRYYVKITRCMWADVYSVLPDLELAYLLECYGDYSKMPYINPNFVLTRTKTCMEGDSMCDFVYHDKQIVKEIKHPSNIFWKNF